ncbi:heterokaryon incompatibility protein-domain-containing protein [Apiospora aurea]|uniref:Heterokaryon incompatibility protein-domain-containing protein n=1 Tax=Apiospora aurea TaxID=335848 RepID=A0ABR1PUH4_9PEZI
MSQPSNAQDTVQLRDGLGEHPSNMGRALTGLESVTHLSSLCKFCEHDERHEAPTTALKRRTGHKYRNTKDVRQRASEGCWVCQCVLSATRLWDDDFPGEAEKLKQLVLRFDAQRFTIRGQANLPAIQIYTSLGEPQVHRLMVPDKEFPRTAGSPSTLNFIQYQLNNCIHSHEKCREYLSQISQGVTSWPSRVLEIQPTTSQIRLVQFELEMAQRYVAVSYCWGPKRPPLKAESSTLRSLREGISWSDLPKTLHDAVALTAKIGYKWIWIDSMCIVQDDEQDWDREAAKMSTVYRHALVTIIASSAACCNEGFLEKARKPSVLLGEVTAEQDKSVEVRGRILYDWGHHRGGPQSHDSHYTKWLDPVDFRGWTLQERVLSTRHLCFTSGEVQFSCHESRACECGQQLFGDMYIATDPEEQWFSTVQEYSRRNLTKQSDVTIAFKGIQHMIATKIQEATCVTMVWLQPVMTPFTARSLLWYRYGYEQVPPYFPKDLNMPSYSWTSLKGEFIHSSPSQFQSAKFPTKCLGLDAEDTKGKEMDGTSIRLLGPLYPAKLAIPEPGGRWPDFIAKVELIDTSGPHASTCCLDGPLERVPSAIEEGGFTLARAHFDTLEESELARTSTVIEETTVAVLLVVVKDEEENHGTGLLLARSAESPDNYQRIGILSLSNYSTPPFPRGPMQEVLVS